MSSTQNASGPPPTRQGYDAKEVVSALQKSIRRSDVDAALFWASELFESGYAPWMWKRLRTITSEDIGPAAPGLAADVRALYENWKDEKANGGGYLYMSHAVIAMCAAPKCRAADWVAHCYASGQVPRREIPDEALDKHTQRGRQMGRGTDHFYDEASRLVQPTQTVAEVEALYRERAVRLRGRRRTSANGGTQVEPAQNDHNLGSGQLSLEDGR